MKFGKRTRKHHPVYTKWHEEAHETMRRIRQQKLKETRARDEFWTGKLSEAIEHHLQHWEMSEPFWCLEGFAEIFGTSGENLDTNDYEQWLTEFRSRIITEYAPFHVSVYYNQQKSVLCLVLRMKK